MVSMDFGMDRQDFRTETWKRMKSRVTGRLDDLRRQNDAPHLDIEKTLVIRGRIAELKDLLDLEAEALSSSAPTDPDLWHGVGNEESHML